MKIHQELVREGKSIKINIKEWKINQELVREGKSIKINSKIWKINRELVREGQRIRINSKKSRIRETPTLSTDADSRTDTNLKRLRDLPIRTKKRT